MSVSAAEELIGALSELRALFPDWRMGQLVANLVTAAGGTDAAAIWDMDDEQLLAAAHRLIERNGGRRAVSAKQDSAEASFAGRHWSPPRSFPRSSRAKVVYEFVTGAAGSHLWEVTHAPHARMAGAF
jgi:hypothetical protein